MLLCSRTLLDFLVILVESGLNCRSKVLAGHVFLGGISTDSYTLI